MLHESDIRDMGSSCFYFAWKKITLIFFYPPKSTKQKSDQAQIHLLKTHKIFKDLNFLTNPLHTSLREYTNKNTIKVFSLFFLFGTIEEENFVSNRTSFIQESSSSSSESRVSVVVVVYGCWRIFSVLFLVCVGYFFFFFAFVFYFFFLFSFFTCFGLWWVYVKRIKINK